MLTRTEYLLTKLGEECNEVGQMTSKTIIFGAGEHLPGHPRNNKERLEAEIIDFLGVVKMLQDDGVIDLDRPDVLDLIHAKINKVEKYMKYSIELGTLEKDALLFSESDLP